MKRVYFLVLALIMVFLFQTSQAVAQPVKIAVVNLDKFQQSSKSFQKTAAVMKIKFEDLQKSWMMNGTSLQSLKKTSRNRA
jgi:Skp family chaperone for outer membrane proteins